MVGVFMKAPIDGFIDSGRRAELTDIADTVVRRVARDVHLALPNSVRNPSNADSSCIEFMPTKTGGRYRSNTDNLGNGNILDFSSEDDSFDMLWLNSTQLQSSQIDVGDIVVISNNGYSGNAYSGNNAIKVDLLTEDVPNKSTSLTFVDAATGSPFNRKILGQELASPFYRFQVIPSSEHVAAYVCSGIGTDSSGNGTGILYRYNRTLSAPRAIPANCAGIASGATAATLASNISSCTLKYEAPGSSTGLGNYGMVVISLEIKQKDEAVSIYHQVQVDNTP
jgi:MSHA biogenesis protein MshO